MPKHGDKTVERLTALGKSFHSDCFKCEVMDKIVKVFVDLSIFNLVQNCLVSLKSSSTGSECYPVDNRPYCAGCSHKMSPVQ